MAKKLLKRGLSPTDIAEDSGLPLEAIQKLLELNEASYEQ